MLQPQPWLNRSETFSLLSSPTLIYNLLTAMVALLQTELGEGPNSIGIMPLADPVASDRPAIGLYPGDWVINPSKGDLTPIQEFQQDFWIDIYDGDLARLEQWSSLITGILLGSHDGLIQQYNTPPEAKPKTEYQTEQFMTRHTLSQFRLLGGAYLSQEKGPGLQLKFTVVGQIKLTKPTRDEGARVKQVVLKGGGVSPEGDIT